MTIARKPMTPHGHRKLKDELREIREVKRPANIAAIEEARAHGDLSENAEYKYAKEQQSFLAGRIQIIETLLALAEIIDPAKLSGDRVVFGATVELLDLETDEEVTYTIVGQPSADVVKGRISIDSPIARGLIGKEVGSEATIRTPKGNRRFEISDVQFFSPDTWK